MVENDTRTENSYLGARDVTKGLIHPDGFFPSLNSPLLKIAVLANY
jgi:hypothetical protein